MRAALLQATTGIDPVANVEALVAAIGEAAGGGAAMLFIPEMSGLLDRDRERSARHIVAEGEDGVLAAVREAAARYRIWVQLGSIAVRRPDGQLANRALVIDDAGAVRARYDKLHLFNVDLPTGERWHELASYAAGDFAVVADTPVGQLGLSVCYDLRFPALYAALSAAGATVLTVPAAFTRPTGAAHWAVLMRARAIENAAFVLAAAQTGVHEDGRATYGRSLAVGPWGDVLIDMGETAGLGFVDLDPRAVADARAHIPVIDHRRPIPPVMVA